MIGNKISFVPVIDRFTLPIFNKEDPGFRMEEGVVVDAYTDNSGYRIYLVECGSEKYRYYKKIFQYQLLKIIYDEKKTD